MFRETKIIDSVFSKREAEIDLPIKVIQVPIPHESSEHFEFEEEEQEDVKQSCFGSYETIKCGKYDHTITFRVVNGKNLQMEEISLRNPKVVHSLMLKFPADIVPSLKLCRSNTNSAEYYLWVLTRRGTLHRILFKALNIINGSSMVDALAQEFNQSILYKLLRHDNRYARYKIMHTINEYQLAIGCENGDMLHVVFNDDDKTFMEYELKEESLASKIWAVLSRQRKNAAIIAIESLRKENSMYLFCLCSDAKIRVWSIYENTYVFVQSILAADQSFSFEDGSMRLYNSEDEHYLIVYYMRNKIGHFECIRVQMPSENDTDSEIEMHFQNIKYAPYANEFKLIDFSIIDKNLWTLWRCNDNTHRISYGPIFAPSEADIKRAAIGMSSWNFVPTLYDNLLETEDSESDAPISIVSFSTDNSVLGLITLKGLSLLLPCELIESLYVKPVLSHEQVRSFLSSSEMMLNESPLLSEDIVNLVAAIRFVASYLNIRDSISFNDFLISQYIKTLTYGTHKSDDGITAKPTIFMLDFRRKFKQIRNPFTAVEKLIEMLKNDRHANFEDLANRTRYPNTALVCNICAQVLETYTELSRDLFIFLSLLSQCDSNFGISREFSTNIDIIYCKEVSNLFTAYRAALWLSKQAIPCLTSYNFYNLSHMRISDGELLKERNFLEVIFNSFKIQEFNTQEKPVIELLMNPVRKMMRLFQSLIGDEMINAISIANILWSNQHFDVLSRFAGFLADKIPHLHHYIGLCLLARGNESEAKKHFIYASLSIVNSEKKEQTQKLFESFDPNYILEFLDQTNNSMTNNVEDSFLFFYFYSLRQFCDNFPRLAIDLLTIALDKVQGSENEYLLEEQIAISYSVLFNNYLMYEEYDDAYAALALNDGPEASEKRIVDLRKFVNVLCNKKQFKRLIQYSYVRLSREVEEELLKVARVSDISKQPTYYHILYSFHIHRGKYDKAALCMFQLANRLDQESNIHDVSFLRLKASCLATAIDTLGFLPQNEQWVTFPAKEDEIRAKAPPSPLKRGREELSIINDYNQGATQQKISNNVVTISNIESAYVLTQAKLLLIEKTSKEKDRYEVGNVWFKDAKAIVHILCTANLYDMAFTVCNKFNLKEYIRDIFIYLTNLCIEYQYESIGTNVARAIPSLLLEEAISAYGNNSMSPVDQLWYLLKYYIELYDPVTYDYSTSVLDHMLPRYQIIAAPLWLIQHLSRNYPQGLLLVYMRHNMFTEAINVAIECMASQITDDSRINEPSNIDRKKRPYISLTVLDLLHQQLDTARADNELKEKFARKLREYITFVNLLDFDL